MITAQTLMWFPLLTYTAAVIPQVIKSWRERSAAGVSQAMVFVRSIAVSYYAIYLFACHLPLAYKVVMPIYLCLLLTLAAQGFYYDAQPSHRRRFIRGYGSAFFAVMCTALLAWHYPARVGMLAGWIAIVCYSVCEIPQVYKNYVRKSVQGFSFLFASMLAVGASMEMMLTISFGLPKPTLASSIRILSFYTMYCFQFMQYRVVKTQL